MIPFTYAYCTFCEKHSYVTALHGEKGGPLCCLLCAGKWNAAQGRRRRARRVVFKALKEYAAAGGSLFGKEFDQLRLLASGLSVSGEADTVGADFSDLTSELLADTIALTHPDKHPPERKGEANRVAQELLALAPA